MAKQKIEIEIGSKPKTKVKSADVAKTHPMPEKKGDVTGQAWEYRAMCCWYCHGISYVWYDTDSYHNYECCYCGAVNRL